MDDYIKINFNFDIPKLKKEIEILLKNKSTHGLNQLALMHRDNCDDPYYFGCGSLDYEGDFSTGKQTKKAVIHQEKEFVTFNKELENTYLYEVYQKINNYTKIARMRIMILDQKTCLTWHRDLQKRIHIPIITDEKCKFVVEDSAFYLPANGDAYVVDTTKYHTVLNGSRIIRIHLIGTIL